MEITLSNVTKTFGKQRAVDDVSFRAGVGITGFLGPNGAGKSTTMRMITGYLEPTEGTITLAGKTVWPSSPQVRAQIGYLPEHNPLYPDMYVREYLNFIAGVHGVDANKHTIDQAIDLVGLQREQHKRIGQLSKGYRQRVGLAQALLHDPAVLILDEPTSGLDPNQLREIRDVIRRLGETKVVLLSTHIMQEVQALCERVLIIDRGKLLADDPIERLGARLAGETTIHIRCEQVPKLATLRALAGVKQVEVSGKSATLSVASNSELRPQVAALCLAEGWGLLELRGEQTSVEQVFQAITRENLTRADA